MSAYCYINPGMIRLLHSPAHQLLSGRIMTASYQGRKSAKDYCTPVSYYRDGDAVYCFTNGAWRYNFSNSHDAVLRIKGRDYSARGAITRAGKQQQIDIMTRYFKAVPQDRKFYGVRCDRKGEPNRAQVEQASHVIDIIRFALCTVITAAPLSAVHRKNLRRSGATNWFAALFLTLPERHRPGKPSAVYCFH
jgi:hypothetical protein